MVKCCKPHRADVGKASIRLQRMLFRLVIEVWPLQECYRSSYKAGGQYGYLDAIINLFKLKQKLFFIICIKIVKKHYKLFALKYYILSVFHIFFKC